ncbi:Uncharacterised protein [Staphylococcus aureus]|nr:Uncharacterised protein [Staphylococcus aureus]
MIPILIAVSFSRDLNIGATAAIAAAPQTPVPTPSNNAMFLSPCNSLLTKSIITILKITTPTSMANSLLP